jgi:hypothetical protein
MIDLRVTEYDLPLSCWAAWSACRRAVPNSITAARSSSNPPQFSPRRTGPYLPVAKTCPHDSRAQAARSEYSSFPGTFDALGSGQPSSPPYHGGALTCRVTERFAGALRVAGPL